MLTKLHYLGCFVVEYISNNVVNINNVEKKLLA